MGDRVTLGGQAKSWLKSLCETGPTRYCLDGVKATLKRQGLAVEVDGVLSATDKGRAVFRAIQGEPSVFQFV